MKLKDYLAQFEGLDPEMEVYHEDYDTRNTCVNMNLYDKSYKLGFTNEDLRQFANYTDDPHTNLTKKVIILI